MTDARSAWDAAAGTWGPREGEASPITDRMVALAAPAPGERVLELACGTGEAGIATALAAAGRVGLVLSDFAPEMVSTAVAAAKAAGLTDIEGRELDLDSITEPDRSYDVVLCRMGIMLVESPETAALEVARVLRPGGRAVLAVWGPRAQNSWLRVVFETLGELWGMELPPADGPSPFALDSRERLHEVLAQTGMAIDSIEEVAAPMEVANAEDWWTSVATGAGPLGQLVGNLPAEQQETVRRRACERIGGELAGRALQRSALVALTRWPRTTDANTAGS